MGAAEEAENHEDEWGLTWCLPWGIYTSISTRTHSHISVVAADSLKHLIYPMSI